LEKEKEEDNKSGYKLELVFQTNHSKGVGKKRRAYIYKPFLFDI